MRYSHDRWRRAVASRSGPHSIAEAPAQAVPLSIYAGADGGLRCGIGTDKDAHNVDFCADGAAVIDLLSKADYYRGNAQDMVHIAADDGRMDAIVPGVLWDATHLPVRQQRRPPRYPPARQQHSPDQTIDMVQIAATDDVLTEATVPGANKGVVGCHTPTSAPARTPSKAPTSAPTT